MNQNLKEALEVKVKAALEDERLRNVRIELERELAIDAAKNDIITEGEWCRDPNGPLYLLWYRLPHVRNNKRKHAFERAALYLELIGLIVYHPEHKDWVRVKDVRGES
jgi:hypothetical protein